MDYFERIGWTPTIGDPSLLGWFTVIAYVYTAYLSFQVIQNSRDIFPVALSRQKNLWLIITLIFTFLAINKQLDLQTFFTRSLRHLAFEQGWYGNRRALQVAFIAIISISGVTFIAGLCFYYSKYLHTHIFSLVGLSFLVCFILIRASSFHHVDIVLRLSFLGFRVNHLLELSGIGLVALNAHRLLLLKRSS